MEFAVRHYHALCNKCGTAEGDVYMEAICSGGWSALSGGDRQRQNFPASHPILQGHIEEHTKERQRGGCGGGKIIHVKLLQVRDGDDLVLYMGHME